MESHFPEDPVAPVINEEFKHTDEKFKKKDLFVTVAVLLITAVLLTFSMYIIIVKYF